MVAERTRNSPGSGCAVSCRLAPRTAAHSGYRPRCSWDLRDQQRHRSSLLSQAFGETGMNSPGETNVREREKQAAARAAGTLGDSGKQVAHLGKFPLPVEVIPFAQALIKNRIAALGAEVSLRCYAYGNPYVTDEGHHIMDCTFGELDDPPALAKTLRAIPGVVE